MGKTGFICLFNATAFLLWTVIFFLADPASFIPWATFVVANVYIVGVIFSMREGKDA